MPEDLGEGPSSIGPLSVLAGRVLPRIQDCMSLLGDNKRHIFIAAGAVAGALTLYAVYSMLGRRSGPKDVDTSAEKPPAVDITRREDNISKDEEKDNTGTAS